MNYDNYSLGNLLHYFDNCIPSLLLFITLAKVRKYSNPSVKANKSGQYLLLTRLCGIILSAF